MAVDCGIKYAIIRQLVERGAEVRLVPWDTPLMDHIEWCDGMFLSNGPGDPTKCDATIENLKNMLTPLWELACFCLKTC